MTPDFQATIDAAIEFMKTHSLVLMRIKTGLNDVAVIKRDKHGFFKVDKTEQNHVR